MEIGNNISFGAKFIENKDFIEVADYAFKKHKMDLFNKALRNIDRIRKDTFIRMDLCYTDKKPTVVFTRFEKGWNKILKKQTDSYVQKRQVDYIAEDEKLSPLKMAFERIIKMGSNAPDNKSFKYVVMEKDESRKPYFLF